MGECPELIHIPHLLRNAGARARRRRPGFSLLEIMIVISILSVLMSIAVPSWMRARSNTQARACAHSLRAIETAKEQYAMRNKLSGSAAVTMTDLINDGLLSAAPTCPAGFSYNVNNMSADPTCTSGLPGHVVNP